MGEPVAVKLSPRTPEAPRSLAELEDTLTAMLEEIRAQRRASEVAEPPRPVFRTPAEIVQCGRYGLTMGTMRWLLFNRHENGLAACVSRVGRKSLLIEEEAFVEWLRSRREGGERASRETP